MQEQSTRAAVASSQTPPAVVDPKPGASAPAASAAAPTISKEDIWGDGEKAGAGQPAATASADPTPGTPPPSAEPSSSMAAPASTLDPPAAPGATPPVSIPGPDTLAVADPASSATSPPATVTPEPVRKPDPAPAKPASVAKPIVAAPAADPQQPWYAEPWALGVAGAGGLLLVLLGIAGMRKRRTADTVSRPSIASAFPNSPMSDSLDVPHVSDAEEEQLIEQVRRDPGNAGAHLELLSLYYAKRDSAAFEAAAEEMYAYVADPNQAEWREARAMGEDLVPHNSLFGGEPDLSGLAGEADSTRSDDAFTFDEPPVGENYPPYSYGEAEQPRRVRMRRRRCRHSISTRQPSRRPLNRSISTCRRSSPWPTPRS